MFLSGSNAGYITDDTGVHGESIPFSEGKRRIREEVKGSRGTPDLSKEALKRENCGGGRAEPE